MKLLTVTVDDNTKKVSAIYEDYDSTLTIEFPVTTGICVEWLKLHDEIRTYLQRKFMPGAADDDLYEDEE